MTQQRATDTRAVLIDAAATEFAHRGYAASSINDILVGAACSKGAMYHHFTSKRKLADAVVRAATGIYATIAKRWLSTADAHPLDALAGLVDDAADAFIDEPVIKAEARLSLEPDFGNRRAIHVWENAAALLVTDAAALGCLRSGFTPEKVVRVLTAALAGNRLISMTTPLGRASASMRRGYRESLQSVLAAATVANTAPGGRAAVTSRPYRPRSPVLTLPE